MNSISRGREHLFSLAKQQDARPQVIGEIEHYFRNLESFHLTWKLIDSGTDARYDVDKHDFSWEKVESAPSGSDRGVWARDHLVHRVTALAKQLFPDSHDTVGQFFMHKLLKHGDCQNTDEFIERGRLEVAEQSVKKILKKIQNNTMKSLGEKEKKKRINNSLFQRISSLRDEIVALRQEIKKLQSFKQNDSRLQKLESKLRKKETLLREIAQVSRTSFRKTFFSALTRLFQVILSFFIAAIGFLVKVCKALFQKLSL